MFQTPPKLSILLMCHKVVVNKILKLWLQIFKELSRRCRLLHKLQFFFRFSFLITIFPKEKNFQEIGLFNKASSSIGQTNRFSTPHISHSPNKHSLAFHSKNSLQGHTTDSQSEVKLGYVVKLPTQTKESKLIMD